MLELRSKISISAKLAAHKVAKLGARSVIIKGGHLDCTDLVLEDGEIHLLKGERVSGGNHGVGCTYSASLTAFLAKGLPLIEAAAKAKQFAAQAIFWSMDVGRGVGPVDQAGALREEADKFDVLSKEKALEILRIEYSHCQGSRVVIALKSSRQN